MDRLIDLWAYGVLISGIGYMGWVFCKQRLVAKSQTWPSVPGTISHSGLGVDSKLAGPSMTSNRTYNASISYRYMVGSRVFTGGTICIGGVLNTSFKDRAQERVDRYREGSTVTVYYNPDKPETSCLERQGEIALFGYLIGGGMAFLGILLLLDVIHPG